MRPSKKKKGGGGGEEGEERNILPFSEQAVAITSCIACATPLLFPLYIHLIGPVVKASSSRAEDPGFESRLHRDFFGVESYQ